MGKSEFRTNSSFCFVTFEMCFIYHHDLRRIRQKFSWATQHLFLPFNGRQNWCHMRIFNKNQEIFLKMYRFFSKFPENVPFSRNARDKWAHSWGQFQRSIIAADSDSNEFKRLNIGFWADNGPKIPLVWEFNAQDYLQILSLVLILKDRLQGAPYTL